MDRLPKPTTPPTGTDLLSEDHVFEPTTARISSNLVPQVTTLMRQAPQRLLLRNLPLSRVPLSILTILIPGIVFRGSQARIASKLASIQPVCQILSTLSREFGITTESDQLPPSARSALADCALPIKSANRP